jgi:P4 family phage/plasmid primase-like protien
VFNDMAEAHDEALRYTPPGEAPEIQAPDVNRLYEIQGAGITDRLVVHRLYDRYAPNFVFSDGTLYLINPTTRHWMTNNLEEHFKSYAMAASNMYHEEYAGVVTALALLNDAEPGAEVRREQLTARRAGALAMVKTLEKGSVMKTVASFLRGIVIANKARTPVLMDHARDMLSCANGVVDLREGSVRHPAPSDYLTKCTDVIFKPDVDYGWWEEVVGQICNGNKRMAEFLQVWFGYCATGEVREHSLVVLYGEGRNGKNILVDAVARCLGNYSKALPHGSLEASGPGGGGMDNNKAFMTAQLRGARMAYTGETEQGSSLKESWIKSQLGDAMLSGRAPRGDFFEFSPTHKLTISTNNKPNIRGGEHAIWKRLHFVEMPVIFGDAAEIADGVAHYIANEKLLEEAISKGGRESVLRWVVEGAVKYYRHGLKHFVPAEVRATTGAAREEQNIIGMFLQETTVPVPAGEVAKIQALEGGGANAKAFSKLSSRERLRVEKRLFFRMFQQWCNVHSYPPIRSPITFISRLKNTDRVWRAEAGEDPRRMPRIGDVYVGSTSFYRYIKLSIEGERLQEEVVQQEAQRSRRSSSDEDRFEG